MRAVIPISAAPAAPAPAAPQQRPRKAPVSVAAAAADPEKAAPRIDYNAIIARYDGKIKNRATAIRAMCVQCCCGVLSEVRNCTVTKCALYVFRTGEDPFRKKREDGFGGNKADSDTEGDE